MLIVVNSSHEILFYLAGSASQRGIITLYCQNFRKKTLEASIVQSLQAS